MDDEQIVDDSQDENVDATAAVDDTTATDETASDDSADETEDDTTSDDAQDSDDSDDEDSDDDSTEDDEEEDDDEDEEEFEYIIPNKKETNDFVIKKTRKPRVINILKTKYDTTNTYKYEIGVDEAGRGPLFGRVYAGAVVLPKDETIFNP